MPHSDLPKKIAPPPNYFLPPLQGSTVPFWHMALDIFRFAVFLDIMSKDRKSQHETYQYV